MAYEFKRLGEVAVVETVTDETNVLIEEDGVIKKTVRKNIGNVRSVNGVEPDAFGDVSFEHVKSVNGIVPDAQGNVTMETSSQMVFYGFPFESPYLYKDDACTTKVTKDELAAIAKDGKTNIVIRMPSLVTGSVGAVTMFPIWVDVYGDYGIVGVFFGEGLMQLYTAEYEDEEPVGPPT